jgi:hypothetical protein
MKYAIGFLAGVIVTVIFPELVPYVKNAFIESGVRDATVQTLQTWKSVK